MTKSLHRPNFVNYEDEPSTLKRRETLAFPIYLRMCTRYSKLDFGRESSLRDQLGIFALIESVFDIQSGIVDFEYPT
ncbi:MAG: hypothetical protein NMNS02_18760 [Nitrosomonas sp.]|nr:MAG: hypothetical protein NMNS02_18760 [Nitrosomonas sp.]